jgi:hypothetical protein
VRPPSLNLQGVFWGVAKLGHLPSKRKGGRFAIIHQKMLKIFKINPTYQYVYECIVKIVYHSYEDGNKKFNHHHRYLLNLDPDICFYKYRYLIPVTNADPQLGFLMTKLKKISQYKIIPEKMYNFY